MFFVPSRNNSRSLSQRGGTGGANSPRSPPMEPENPDDAEVGNNTVIPLETQQGRRQDILRLCMIVVLILFLFDGDGGNNGSASHSNSDHTWSREKVVLPSTDTGALKAVFSSPQGAPFPTFNVTGMFRGSWRQEVSLAGRANHTEGGSTLVQLESFDVQGVPELSFIYGLIRTYRSPESRLAVDFSVPVQGVLLVPERRLLLFSTPYKTQRVGVRIQKIDAAVSGQDLQITSTSSDQVVFKRSNQSMQVSLFLADLSNASIASALSANTSTENPAGRIFLLGDRLLSARFRFLQLSPPHAAAPNASSIAAHRFCHYLIDTRVSDSFHRDSDGNKEKVLSLDGSITTGSPCERSLTVSAISYDLHFGVLQRKVDIYSFAMFVLCLVQVAAVVMQIRHASSPAMAAKMSIFGILAQALLDAVICMGHMMLSAALPDIFFAPFMWIAIVKLVLFSAFQMRMVVNAYKARYAQEISSEGWRGLRSRMINLHLRFYGAVIFVLMLVVSFPSSPTFIITLLYSFWVPQIVYSAVAGTRHPFHPAYLIGMSASRLFLPLYMLGCPNNFAIMLWEYFSPHYELSSHAARHHMLSPSSCYFLLLWMLVQVAVLTMQTAFGPRFFVPKRFLPLRYDYHRPLPPALQRAAGGEGLAAFASAEGAGSESRPASTLSSSTAYPASQPRTMATPPGVGEAPSGDNDSDGSGQGIAMTMLNLLRSTGSGYYPLPTQERRASEEAVTDMENGGQAAGQATEHSLECVICYNPIVLQSQRQQYMITPCDHIFHQECLSQWMNVKLECPVCRASLPILDEEE